MNRSVVLTALLLTVCTSLMVPKTCAASPPSAGVLGDWTEPGGSVILVEHCASGVCAKLTRIAADVPTAKDGHNPDVALRSRPMCGLEIGHGFTLNDPDHAKDGTLYDPKSGKTYHGEMTAEGSALKLRGYVGIPLFGRTETWHRPSAPVAPCHP
jgi:uncharacterized protein (DUF2147 family)